MEVAPQAQEATRAARARKRLGRAGGCRIVAKLRSRVDGGRKGAALGLFAKRTEQAADLVAGGNMVDNALRYGEGPVTLAATIRNSSVEMHVLDEGTGFEPAFVQRAFERFSRGDETRSVNGSGLGLAIVETVVRAHDGTAHAANCPAGGADLWISTPHE